jgi:GntR family negative regulator for fad regulon and positive regulator of fabA
MDWETPPKAAELTETRLILAILNGIYPITHRLPAERELAAQLGVTRPTLREALQRLSRDGWIEIRHGRSTRVRNYWQEGNLGVLGAMARYPQHAPDDFVPNLLRVRQLLAPDYTRLAVSCRPQEVLALMKESLAVEDSLEAFALVDWNLHHRLSIYSGNPIFTLILNGFEALYLIMAPVYFSLSESRAHSRGFYDRLLAAARDQDPLEAEAIMRETMLASLDLWTRAIETKESVQVVKD